MYKKFQKMTNATTRKYFEASIHDISKLYGVTPLEIRNELKQFFVRKKIIERSTTELSDEQLQSFAEALNKFFNHMNRTPPNERCNLDLQFIFDNYENDINEI